MGRKQQQSDEAKAAPAAEPAKTEAKAVPSKKDGKETKMYYEGVTTKHLCVKDGRAVGLQPGLHKYETKLLKEALEHPDAKQLMEDEKLLSEKQYEEKLKKSAK